MSSHWNIGSMGWEISKVCDHVYAQATTHLLKHYLTSYKVSLPAHVMGTTLFLIHISSQHHVRHVCPVIGTLGPWVGRFQRFVTMCMYKQQHTY
jgi:hypothetical protein